MVCEGLEFTYNVRTGTCEVFANCICLGIWDIECVQGEEHPHVHRILTGMYRLSKWHGYKTQQKDLLRKLAKRLQQNGFIDDDILHVIKASKSISNTIQSEVHTERTQERERYIYINVWEILEGISIENCDLRSDWSNEERGRMCDVINSESERPFQSHIKSLFNHLPRCIRNMTDCSIEDFVTKLEEHLQSVDGNEHTSITTYEAFSDLATTSSTNSNSDTNMTFNRQFIRSFRRLFKKSTGNN